MNTRSVTALPKKITSIQTSAGERIVPVYENNQLIRSDVFEGNERTGFTNYTFENELLKRVTLYWGSGADFQPFFELNFTHDNTGNNTETVAMVANGVPGQLVRAGHITYKYDSKTNPLFGQKDLLVLLLQSASKNNIIQEDHFDEHLTLEDRFTYNYTYKTNGLPQRAEVINGLPDENPTTSQVEYVYQ